MPSKVFQLTSVHHAFDARIFHKQCISLARSGFEVTLFAAGYEEEDINGVRIRSVPKEKNRLWRILKTPWKIYRKALMGNADIYHFHDPEFILNGILLSLHGKKVIYDVHEDYPKQTLEKFWIPIFLRKPISWLISAAESIGSRIFFTAIIAATPAISDRFPSKKTIVVQNFPKKTDLDVFQKRRYTKRPENIVYVGVISRIRGVFENIRAMEDVKHDFCRFVLVGEFSNLEDKKKCEKIKSWSRVDYKGWMNREQIAKVLNISRAGLVLLHPTANYIDAFPVKLFEYMAAGIPVIASDFPLWRRIVEEAKCGILVDPLQKKMIANAIDWILDNPLAAEKMGKNGKKAIVKKYNWNNECKKLVDLYEEIM